MKLVAAMLMKSLNFITRVSGKNHPEVQNKEAMVGWNAKTEVVRHLGDLLPTHSMRDTDLL